MTTVAQCIAWLIPFGVLGNLRSIIYRLAGYRGIAPNVWFHGAPTFRGLRGKCELLEIGECSSINTPCVWDLNGPIKIGKRVGIGPYSLFFTGTHEIGPPHERRGRITVAGIEIGDGAWIGARVTILPGVTIGDGAVVAAGSIVRRNVAPHTLVGGTPARFLRALDVVAPHSRVVMSRAGRAAAASPSNDETQSA